MKPKLFAPLSNLKKPTEDFFYHHCSVGHQSHSRTLVDRNICGIEVTYQIYDWREYFITVDGNETVSEHGKYCTGQDIISYCIDKQEVWEAEETAVQVAILRETTSGIMLDIGSHIGYYSMLAAKLGYTVASFDSSQENLALLHESAEVNQVVDKIHPYLCLLDDQVPILSRDAEEVQLVKIDIEGAERHAIQMCADLIGGRKIKYLIMEVSPVFNDTYPALVETIAGQGYDVYQIPTDKNWEHYQGFLDNPLVALKHYCQVPEAGRKEYVAGLHQENFVFVRQNRG
jgi:hypothetical protein